MKQITPANFLFKRFIPALTPYLEKIVFQKYKTVDGFKVTGFNGINANFLIEGKSMRIKVPKDVLVSICCDRNEIINSHISHCRQHSFAYTECKYK